MLLTAASEEKRNAFLSAHPRFLTSLPTPPPTVATALSLSLSLTLSCASGDTHGTHARSTPAGIRSFSPPVSPSTASFLPFASEGMCVTVGRRFSVHTIVLALSMARAFAHTTHSRSLRASHRSTRKKKHPARRTYTRTHRAALKEKGKRTTHTRARLHTEVLLLHALVRHTVIAQAESQAHLSRGGLNSLFRFRLRASQRYVRCCCCCCLPSFASWHVARLY